MKEKIEQFFEKLGEVSLSKWIRLIIFCLPWGVLIVLVGVLLYLPVIGILMMILLIAVTTEEEALFMANGMYLICLLLIFGRICVRMHKKIILDNDDLDDNEKKNREDQIVAE